MIGYDGYYGGITGSASGTISGCEFDGTVKAVKDLKNGQSGLAYLGGITGDFSSAVSAVESDRDEKAEDFAGIVNCVNKGNIEAEKGSASAHALGGSTGSVYLSDSRYTVTIENCKNVGKVFSTNHYYAGIAADACIKTDSTLTVSGCTNEVDFTEGEGAGIVHHLAMQKGNLVLSDCVNHGKIVSSGQNAAGILCYTTNMGNDWNLELENCENTGDISSEVEAGGIACFTAYYKTEENANTSFAIRNCKNSGNLSSPTTNGYMGGILAVDGFMLTKTEIDGCENSGNISFTKQWVMGEADLKTENDEGEKEDASLFTLSVMRGILGDCSCTNGFSVNFENCTYSTERGVGNVELPDSTLEKMAAGDQAAVNFCEFQKNS